jgi:hypothetical protein
MGTPAMCSNDGAIERSSRGPRRLNAVVAGLVGLLAAALLSGVEVSLPTPARAEVAAPPVAGLCFHGQGGELLDFAPAGQRCR